MPIKQDHSALPDDNDGGGQPPVANPRIVHHLAQAWYDDYLGGDEHVPSATWWASMAGMCARSVGYSIIEGKAKRELATIVADPEYKGLPHDGQDHTRELDIETMALAAAALAPTNPPSIADAWRMGLGSMVHAQLQAILPKVFPGAEVELRATIDDFGSAHADALITDAQGKKILLELKTMNGFGYKLAATSFKGPAEGPKSNWVKQGAVAARAVEADLLIIGVLSLECVSPDQAKRDHLDDIGRFAAEWHFTPEQYLPIAESEIKRTRKIIELVDAGQLPPRHHPDMPANARITDPSSGAWVIKDESGAITKADKFWGCAYCWNRDRCISDGAS